ncbi:tRNA1(Val) (adenine(37)-N6)-methyltransferase [Oceanisphaera avium]|uniref:tRNA1(Val) (adenine(37)-N6)-methyltransferase n=1 Tax=Oceanisphaera avium TaxID=1903694 RepID=A0A1Y0CYN0_9GAMM|nr:methyltransferase [Oceanisphaera avium]ART80124.1 tRNA (adenosine(37)-N6)-methyltransferase TrmM [Oceanisphaera avium]
MSSRGFTFKQFHINHDRCAMKVGTDGILLGAWVTLAQAKRILDVGTGSGLVALMLAQRTTPEVKIIGLELDKQAAIQACENVAASPWPQKVVIKQGALQAYQEQPFDLIVANPPYFKPGQAFECQARQHARHTSSLSLADLFKHTKRLLQPSGRLAVILPYQALDIARQEAQLNNLYLVEQQEVYTKEGKEASRFLGLFCSVKSQEIREQLWINTANQGYSESYLRLVRPFYLKL